MTVNRHTDGPAIVESLSQSIFSRNAEKVFHYSNSCYIQPDLPFAFDALEPDYPADLLEAHYRLHGRFTCMLNTMREHLWKARQAKDVAAMHVYSRLMAFIRSEHILHCLLWYTLEPGGRDVPEDLDRALAKDFGSTEKAMDYFTSYAHAQEDRGWMIIGHDASADRLRIFKTGELVNMAFWPVTPLLALDLWEHAYSSKTGVSRHSWIDRFMRLVNWQFVGRRYLENKRSIVLS